MASPNLTAGELDLRNVCDELGQVKHKIFKIGVQLGVPYNKIKELQGEPDFFSAVLHYWLCGNVTKVPLSWNSIVKALKSSHVDECGLANRMEKKYWKEEDGDGSGYQASVISSVSSGSSTFKLPSLNLKPYFPYLIDNDNGTNDDLSLLRVKLDKHTNKLKRAFATLVYKLQKELEDLSKFDDVTKVLKHLRENLLTGCKSISDVFEKIGPHISFFDFGIIKLLVSTLGSTATKKKLKKYKAMFCEFCKQRVCETPNDAFGDVSKSEKVFVMKIDKNIQTLEMKEVKSLQVEVCEVLEIDLRLLQVKEGCIELCFKSLGFDGVTTVTQKQQDILKSLSILSIIYDGEVLEISMKETLDKNSDSGIYTEKAVTDETSSSCERSTVADPMDAYAVLKPKKLPSFSPLYRAVASGDITIVKELINNNEDPNVKDINGNSCLHYAAIFGHLHILKYLIEECDCPSGTEGFFKTNVLHLAAFMRHLSMVRYLVESQNLDPNVVDGFNNPVMYYAILGGDVHIVRYLIESMTSQYMKLEDILYNTPEHNNPPDKSGQFPLQDFSTGPLCCACCFGHLSIVKYLVEECNCNISHKEGRSKVTPVESAISNDQLEIVQYLAKRKEFTIPKRPDNEPGLVHFAVEAASARMVKYLIETLHCDYKKKWDNQTTLQRAALCGKLDIIKYFLEILKCDPSIKGENGACLIHFAARRQQMDVIKYLLENKYSTASEKDDFGDTPLIIAASKGFLPLVKYLTLEQKCDPLMLCGREPPNTCLHAAASEGDINMFSFFVKELKCDPNVKDGDGNIPLINALLYGQQEFVSYAIKHLGCDPTVVVSKLITGT